MGLICCIAGSVLAERAASVPVVYPPSEGLIDDRSDYPRALLELALHESGVPYDLHQGSLQLPQARALAMLAAGKEISVYWSMTNRQRETDLLPVRIPIDKGLLGWRLLLIRASDQARFSSVTSIEQLKKLTIGQGHDWPDTEILGADGFAVEASLALHYPAAEYFFVNRDNATLADTLKRGLTRAIDDGSFDKLFTLYFADQIGNAHLERRRILELPNPLLPAETPLKHPAYWFRPPSGSRFGIDRP